MSTERQKLDRWIEKLLDTGKRNNLINFKDSKLSTVEIVFPDDESIFARRDFEYTYDVYEPPIDDYDDDEEEEEEFNEAEDLDKGADANGPKDGKLSPKEEFVKRYSKKVNTKSLLVYSTATNPISTLKKIAKKSRELQDETGVNATYIAFGFIRWSEEGDAKNTYKAPILLVRVNVIAGSVIDPVKIQICDDDIVVNPTFNYKLQSEYGTSLPDFDDDYKLDGYFHEVAEIVNQFGWEIVRECKLGIFTFLKLAMYEDLKNNAKLLLNNEVVKSLIGYSPIVTEKTISQPLKDPLVELHTVVDADHSQLEAVEMAKSGKSFVLQGPPGTGKSQTITNIIAECLYDGKKVLFVSEKQAALNVVFEKLKKAGLGDFCLELHSHKVNKKAVIEELNRTLESSPIFVSADAEEVIQQKIFAIDNLDAYANALHRCRRVINTSLFQLFEKYSALRHHSDFSFEIPDIGFKGTDYFNEAIKLLDEYASFIPDFGNDYRLDVWYGFTSIDLDYNQRNQLKEDIETLIDGYESLISLSEQIQEKYNVSINNYSKAKKWESLLSFLANSDVITPSLLDLYQLPSVLSHVRILEEQFDYIAQIEREKEEALSSQSDDRDRTLDRLKEKADSCNESIQITYDLTTKNLENQLDAELRILTSEFDDENARIQEHTSSELESLRIKLEEDYSSISKSASEDLEALFLKYAKEKDCVENSLPSELTKTQSRYILEIENIKTNLFKFYSEEIVDGVDGVEIYDKINGQFHSFFSRTFKFKSEYNIFIKTTFIPYLKDGIKYSYKIAKETALLLKNLSEKQKQLDIVLSERMETVKEKIQQIDILYRDALFEINSSYSEKLGQTIKSYEEDEERIKSLCDNELQENQKYYEDIKNKKNIEYDVRRLEYQKKRDEEITKNIEILNENLEREEKRFEAIIANTSTQFGKQILASRNAIEENETHVKDILGKSYTGSTSDWSHIIDSLEKIKEILKGNDIPLSTLTSMTNDEYFSQLNNFKNDAEKLQKEIAYISEAKKRIITHFSSETFDFNTQNFNICYQKLRNCLSQFDKISLWTAFLKLLHQIDNASLLPYIDQVIKRKIAPNQIIPIFKKIFYKNWIEYILSSDAHLASFSRGRQDNNVTNFSRSDEASIDVSKHQIAAKLSLMRPELDVIHSGSAVAKLRLEGRKKRKQFPIRKLLTEIGGLAQTLKPCFLMSPLSVSSLLDPNSITFDVVIFDEASQVFPQDALGAIYRAKQAIVVGDSQQMPPSNFFNVTIESSEDDEEEDVSDFDSILDICSSVFTTKRLLWHYRSRYESLISFSNIHFYNSSLVTFPSASTNRADAGVNHYFVDGVFDRKTKTNRAEAEFIVDLVFKNIVNHPERSLGVVAFSLSQQNLIDKLITQYREKNLSYEWFFDPNRPEPFFIKNLETVQGDERDTIIFSVAYARDAEGRFLQNFGPLNRSGGERRLNVAITRAKDNVQFVSSIRHTDIDTSAAKSKGAGLLKAYLNFAENGESTLDQPEPSTNNDYQDQNNNLEEEIAEFLRSNDYLVDIGVGNSTSRIDLGVKTTNSADYIMAIECDGRNYRNFKNVRDRDRLRKIVLENMGWVYYRIWSTSWYRDVSSEKKRLLLALKEAVNKRQSVLQSIVTSVPQRNSRNDATSVPQRDFRNDSRNDATSVPQRDSRNDSRNDATSVPQRDFRNDSRNDATSVPQRDSRNDSRSDATSVSQRSSRNDSRSDATSVFQRDSQSVPSNISLDVTSNNSQTTLKQTSNRLNLVDSDAFLTPKNSYANSIKKQLIKSAKNDDKQVQLIKAMFPEYEKNDAVGIIMKHNGYNNKDSFQDAIFEILLKEAPLNEEDLIKRIPFIFGREFISKDVVEQFNNKMLNCEKKNIIRRDGFLYIRDQIIKLRIPGHRRRVEYIAIEELASGIHTITQEYDRMKKDDLYVLLTQILDCHDTENAITRFDEALALLKRQGTILEDNGIVRLKTSSS